MNAQRTACILALVLTIAGMVAISTALPQGSGNPADIVISTALAQGGSSPTDIVIGEVMFNAITETSSSGYGEWVEIHNRGQYTVSLIDWSIRDNTTTRTITSTMCPNPQCEIPPGGCWLIAWNNDYLQREFNYYTSPLSLSVQLTSTIFLSTEIGNGLSNSADWVALIYTDGKAVDCVSWSSPTYTNCSNLSYVPGGNGVDTNLSKAKDGQSITNIQGQWYYHQINGSPYNCSNTAQGGNPTAVTLSTFSARPWVRPWLILVGAVGAGAVAILLHRRGNRPQRSPRARAGP